MPSNRPVETEGADKHERLRVELEGKIEKKVPIWVLVGLIPILGFVAYIIIDQLNGLEKKYEDLAQRTTKIEGQMTPLTVPKR